MACSARNIFTSDEAMAVMHGAQALLLELPRERLISVDAAWRLVRADTWQGERLSEVVTELVTSRGTVRDLCSSVVIVVFFRGGPDHHRGAEVVGGPQARHQPHHHVEKTLTLPGVRPDQTPRCVNGKEAFPRYFQQ